MCRFARCGYLVASSPGISLIIEASKPRCGNNFESLKNLSRVRDSPSHQKNGAAESLRFQQRCCYCHGGWLSDGRCVNSDLEFFFSGALCACKHYRGTRKFGQLTGELIGEIGNGRAAAILLARHGAKVALVDYNADWAKETKRMIDEEGGVSEVIQADVTDEVSCKNAVNKTVELWGGLHILVNIGR